MNGDFITHAVSDLRLLCIIFIFIIYRAVYALSTGMHAKLLKLGFLTQSTLIYGTEAA